MWKHGNPNGKFLLASMVANAINLLVVAIVAAATASSDEATERPHIFMMLVDDWGSYDASYRVRSGGLSCPQFLKFRKAP